MTSNRHDQPERDGIRRGPITVPTSPVGASTRYLVREARVPIGDDYVVERDDGSIAFEVDGKLIRIRESLTVTDPSGHVAFQIRGTLLDGNDVLIVSTDDTPVATIRRTHPEPARTDYAVELPGEDRVDVIGDPGARTYSLNYAGFTIASTSRAWMALGSGYRVQIAPGQDDSVVLAMTICLDVMSRRT